MIFFLRGHLKSSLKLAIRGITLGAFFFSGRIMMAARKFGLCRKLFSLATVARFDATGERLTNNVALAKELDSPMLPDGGRTEPMKLASFGSETDPVELANPSPNSGGASND